jgi:hypothetical protein
MKFQCYSCSKSFGGSGLTVKMGDEVRTYCADCLWTLKKEFNKKKTCEECGYFNVDSCEKTSTTLVPVAIGINTYFVEAEECKDYTPEKCLKGEMENKNNQMVIDFASLKDVLLKGGIVMTFFKCPNCNSKLNFPETGKVLICSCCKTPVKPVDIFERIKSLL